MMVEKIVREPSPGTVLLIFRGLKQNRLVCNMREKSFLSKKYNLLMNQAYAVYDVIFIDLKVCKQVTLSSVTTLRS
jgi:hypothetical protein